MAHRRVDRQGRSRRAALTAWGFELSSRLHAAPEDLWARVASVDGINLELAPWLRITAPRDAGRLEDLPVGRPAFRVWVLLLGLVPVEVGELTLARVDPLHGYRERSRLLTVAEWEHERTLARDGDATVLTDRVRALPRVRSPARLQRALVLATFRHRHRRLRAAYGGPPARRPRHAAEPSQPS